PGLLRPADPLPAPFLNGPPGGPSGDPQGDRRADRRGPRGARPALLSALIQIATRSPSAGTTLLCTDRGPLYADVRHLSELSSVDPPPRRICRPWRLPRLSVRRHGRGGGTGSARSAAGRPLPSPPPTAPGAAVAARSLARLATGVNRVPRPAGG